jgi:hypothetical protein
MKGYALLKDEPTIYTYPWEGVPVGKYYLHTKGGFHTIPITVAVVVEKSQHSELYVRYEHQSALLDPRVPHPIKNLSADDVLRPRGKNA